MTEITDILPPELSALAGDILVLPLPPMMEEQEVTEKGTINET